MKKKALLFLIGFFTALTFSPDVSHAQEKDMNTIRLAYHDATKDKENAERFFALVENTTQNSQPVLIAYKGGGLALLARYAKLLERKKKLEEATEWIENAVKKEPSNPEIRLIRLSVQENLPKFLKYNENIEEDRKMVEQALGDTKDESLKKMIEGYFAKFSKKD